MTINLMARGTTAPPLRPGHRRRLLTIPGRRRLLTVSGLAGVGYSLSWIAGLAVRGRPSGLRRLEMAIRKEPAITAPPEEA